MKKEERVLLLLLLNALIEYSVSGKSDVRGQGSGMVAELNVGNLFLGDRVLSDFNSLTRASAKGIGMHAYRIAVNRQAVKSLICGRFAVIFIKNQTAEAVWKNYFFLFLLINPVIIVNKITAKA